MLKRKSTHEQGVVQGTRRSSRLKTTKASGDGGGGGDGERRPAGRESSLIKEETKGGKGGEEGEVCTYSIYSLRWGYLSFVCEGLFDFMRSMDGWAAA